MTQLALRVPLLPSVLMLLAASACGTPDSSIAARPATNASMTFVVGGADGALDRPVTTCLAVAKPNALPLRNGAAGDGTVDGRAEFPAGTRAEAMAARYAALLTRHGWVAGKDFVAAENSLHFYGITDLAAGSGDPQLRVYGATDSDRVPFREVPPAAK